MGGILFPLIYEATRLFENDNETGFTLTNYSNTEWIFLQPGITHVNIDIGYKIQKYAIQACLPEHKIHVVSELLAFTIYVSYCFETCSNDSIFLTMFMNKQLTTVAVYKRSKDGKIQELFVLFDFKTPDMHRILQEIENDKKVTIFVAGKCDELDSLLNDIKQTLKMRFGKRHSLFQNSKGKYMYTYSYAICEPFIELQHKEETKICLKPDQDEHLSLGVLRQLVVKGENALHNKISWKETKTFYSKRNKINDHMFLLWKSTSVNPNYRTDPDCELAATILIHPPSEGWPDEVVFQYTVYLKGRGPVVDVTEIKTGLKCKAKLKEATDSLDIVLISDMTSAKFEGAITIASHKKSQLYMTQA